LAPLLRRRGWTIACDGGVVEEIYNIGILLIKTPTTPPLQAAVHPRLLRRGAIIAPVANLQIFFSLHISGSKKPKAIRCLRLAGKLCKAEEKIV